MANNKNYYLVRFYFGQIGEEKDVISSQSIPAFMCVPSILEALAFSHKALFVTCDKYGCKQFNPWPSSIRPEFYSAWLNDNYSNRFNLI